MKLLLVSLFAFCAAAQDAPTRAYRIADGVSAPTVISKVEPEYSEEARIGHVEGIVVLSVVVAADGAPRELRVLRPLGWGLNEKAMEAVQKWRFSPGKKEGQPVAVQATIEVNFRLLPDPSHPGWSLVNSQLSNPPAGSRPHLTKAAFPRGESSGTKESISISLDIDEHGNPAKVTAEKSSDPKLESAWIETMQKWRFEPAMQNGNPVATHATLHFERPAGNPVAAASNPRTEPYHVGGDVSAPKITFRVEPKYTPEATIAKMEGAVLLGLVVQEDGTPQNVRVTRSLGLGLDENAIGAVSTWHFLPGFKQGKPVPVIASIEVFFRLLLEPNRWHLAKAAFLLPEGASRPHITKAHYPDPAGPREKASVTLSLDIDEQGKPANVQANKSSDPKWEKDVIDFVNKGWRFQPAMKDGQPVVSRATLDFARGDN